MTDVFRLNQGEAPLLVSFPHSGTALPPGLFERFTAEAQTLDDTDWLLPELYDFVRDIGASTIVPLYSRYLIDLNRPANDTPLYPGRRGTALIPTEDFFGKAIYRTGAHPSPEERAARLASYWRPYHEAIRAELDRLRAVHGRVLLWDAHSIRNVVPLLFEGTLPDLNIGSADETSADRAVTEAIAHVAEGSAFSTVTNGRFKGGYITRAYGKPLEGIHAVQLEMSKAIYLAEGAKAVIDGQRAEPAKALLRRMVSAALDALRGSPHA